MLAQETNRLAHCRVALSEVDAEIATHESLAAEFFAVNRMDLATRERRTVLLLSTERLYWESQLAEA